MKKKEKKIKEPRQEIIDKVVEMLNKVKLEKVNEMKIVKEAEKERIPKEKILEIFCYWQGYNRVIKNIEVKIRIIKKELKKLSDRINL